MCTLQTLLNLALTWMVVWLFKDGYVSKDAVGAPALTDGNDAIVAVAEATAAVPLYITPVLNNEQRRAIRTVSISYVHPEHDIIEEVRSIREGHAGALTLGARSDAHRCVTGPVPVPVSAPLFQVLSI